jgi:hypothetical protein
VYKRGEERVRERESVGVGVGVGKTENKKQHFFSEEKLRVTRATPTLECRQWNNSNAAEHWQVETGVGMEKVRGR